MKNKIIKILILIIGVALFITLAESKIYAAETAIASGSCGEKINWSLDKNGNLLISGSGEMSNGVASPWEAYKDKVKTVTFNGNITKVGENAFAKNNNIEKIELPDTIRNIGKRAFAECANLKEVKLPKWILYIESNSFYKCTSLQKVDIPESIIYIYQSAFAECTSLKSVTIRAFFCSINDNPQTISPTATIYAHDLSSAFYYARFNGRKFVDLDTNKASTAKITNADYLKALPTKNVKALGPTAHHGRSIVNNRLYGYKAEFCYESNTSRKEYKEIKAIVEELTANCKTEIEKARAICHWVYLNVDYKYGYGAYADIERVYSIYNEKIGNCEAYTLLTNYMLYLCNIPTGTAANLTHMWTVAYVDGKWIYMDPTGGIVNGTTGTTLQISFAYDGLVYVIDDPARGAYVTGIAKPESEIENMSKYTIPNNSYMKGIYKTSFPTDIELTATTGTVGENFIRNNRKCVYVSGKQIIGRTEHGTNKVVIENRIEPTYTKEGSYDQVTRCSKCNTEINRVKRTINKLTPTILLGDINKDGKINAKDARLALLYYIGKEKLTAEQIKNGDVNKDGKVNAKDARQILLYYIGKVTKF